MTARATGEREERAASRCLRLLSREKVRPRGVRASWPACDPLRAFSRPFSFHVSSAGSRVGTRRCDRRRHEVKWNLDERSHLRARSARATGASPSLGDPATSRRPASRLGGEKPIAREHIEHGSSEGGVRRLQDLDAGGIGAPRRFDRYPDPHCRGVATAEELHRIRRRGITRPHDGWLLDDECGKSLLRSSMWRARDQRETRRQDGDPLGQSDSVTSYHGISMCMANAERRVAPGPGNCA